MKALLYSISRFFLKLIARPGVTGTDNLPSPDSDAEVVYVLHHRALTDLIMLDMVCNSAGLPPPLSNLDIGDTVEKNRFFSLYRAKGGRMTMPTHSKRMLRLLNAPPAVQQNTYLVPVSVFWGRAMSSDGSLLRNLTSEHWAATGRFKRLLNLVINRKNIIVHTGRPICVADIASEDEDESRDANILARRAARLLRVRLRQQKETALGPDFSHRRMLLDQVVSSPAVKHAINEEIASGKKPKKSKRAAHKYARTIASDMSHPTIRVLGRLLSWFWNKIYDGIEVSGLERLEEVSASHALIYVPSHRSHLDYLLLSYLLYYRGFMIPHIAAGDNLNLPIVGGLLRRGGAFFMQRSFRDNPLYAAVFNEYLYQVYSRGHCVEFFPEGGRTRTGRLLPARMGLLKMTVDHQRRGLPKPLALIPVYFGYEKVVEGSSYLSELRGASKKSESVLDVFRNLKLIRQDFGHVNVNFGKAIELDTWLSDHADQNEDKQLQSLSRDIMVGINKQANLNPVNLVALVTLSTPKIAIEEDRLAAQISCYQQLIQKLHCSDPIQVCEKSADEIITYVEKLGLLSRDEETFGAVLTHAPFSAVLMTWYRNNVVHTLALPSLIACLMVKRRRGISAQRLQDMVSLIFPYLAAELSCEDETEHISACLEVMTELKLLDRHEGLYCAPNPAQQEHLQLTLLANLVSQTLERMFIVIHLLAQGSISREELLERSKLVAQRISKLYGINAPEFSDQRLFELFLRSLENQGMARRSADGMLNYDPMVERVLRAAEFVIDPQIRHGVLSATNHT